MRLFVVVCTAWAVSLASCDLRKKEKGIEKGIEKQEQRAPFDMYQMSETALLMEQLYVTQLALKQRIVQGDTLLGGPPEFSKNLAVAVLSDPSDRDAFYHEQLTAFLQAQELIYRDPTQAKRHFNNMVNHCISCHQVKCGGPIGRIKKLYIH